MIRIKAPRVWWMWRVLSSGTIVSDLGAYLKWRAQAEKEAGK